MRILLVNEKRGYFGGVEQNVADTVVALRKRGHECLLAYGNDARDAENYSALFSQCFPCNELTGDDTIPDALPFASIVESCPPDVIYLHKVADVSFVQSFLGKIRIVRMIHDHDLCCPRRHKYYSLSGHVCHKPAGWRCWLDGAFITRKPGGIGWLSITEKLSEMKRNRNFDGLLVGSRFMQKELIQNGFSQDRVHIVPPAVDFAHGKTTPSPVPDNNNILYAGQLIRGKGVDLLLRALAQLKIKFKLTLVGTGNAAGDLQALAETLGIAHQAEFVKWVPHDRLVDYFSAARIVVVPSRWPEPFGMVGLEAMHCARPVIGFKVGGIPDWLEHGKNGLLVNEQDTKALCQALSYLLTDYKLAAKLGQTGFAQVRERFSFARYISTLEQHLGALPKPDDTAYPTPQCAGAMQA